MNYRHAFHAGNFADVMKHAVLARVLAYLAEKPAAYRVIDTHAGAGVYDLSGSEAMRTGEWRDGIGRLAGKGEQAIHRLAELPGGTRALSMFNDLRTRVDDLSKRMRGVDQLEERVAKLEKDIAALKRAQKPSAQKAPTRRAGA